MHHRHAILAVLLLAPTLGNSAFAQEKAVSVEFTATDVDAVRDNLLAFMEGDPIDDPETFFSQFTEDVYWKHGAQTPWIGMEELKMVNWCHELSSELTVDRVEGSGSLAYGRGTYTLSLDCGGESSVDSEGVYLSVHRRQDDGSWRIEAMLQNQ